MLLGGLWHGANWTFVIWGFLHGLYLAAERFFGTEQLPRDASITARFLRGFLTFHLVCLAWVFFRATSAAQAFGILKGIFVWQAGAAVSAWPVAALVALIGLQLMRRKIDFDEIFLRRPTASRWFAYGALAVIATALASGRSPEFIYFQF